jgi:hypothetical protein
MRVRRIEPADPAGEPICTLTAGAARRRRTPIDRLLEDGDFVAAGSGYEVRLPRGDREWEIANAFVEEEAACCASFGFEVIEQDDAIVVTGRHGGFSTF